MIHDYDVHVTFGQLLHGLFDRARYPHLYLRFEVWQELLCQILEDTVPRLEENSVREDATMR